MTTGETEEREIVGDGGGSMKLPPSFTTLSTIAIQAGQSQITVSVLKSGSVVHLQLVQVHPGLCEVGSDLEENQLLIQEQQQLMEKLKKHEREVLSVVEKSRQTEQRKTRKNGGMKKQEEEEGLYEARLASLNEGWSLLLCLLERRQEVLTLAADFYRRALEFSDSIDRVEDLQISSEDGRLTYESMRKGILGKSLQVLTSSSVLLQKLRQLQRTEALQRRGGVLQDKEEEDESSQSSQCSSRGASSKLEELVEALQDRRRRADQAVRLRLQQVENSVTADEREESGEAEDWSFPLDKVLESGSMSAESFELEPETGDLPDGSRPEGSINLESGFKFNLNLKLASSEGTQDLPLGSRSVETRNTQPGSTLAETTDLGSDSRTESVFQKKENRDLKGRSRPEETRNLQSAFKFNLKSRSDLKLASDSEDTQDLHLGSSLVQTSGSKSDELLGLGLDVNTETMSETLYIDTDPGPAPEEAGDLESRFTLNTKAGCRSNLKTDSEETTDPPPGPRSDVHPGSRLDLKFPFKSDVTKNLQSGSTSVPSLDLKLSSRREEIRDLRPRSRPEADVKCDSRPELKPRSLPEETLNPKSGFKLNFKSRSESTSADTQGLQPRFGLDVKTKATSDQTRFSDSGSRSEETRNLQCGSASAEIHHIKLDSTSKEAGDLLHGSRSEERINLESGFKSRSDVKTDSKSQEIKDPLSRLKLNTAATLHFRSLFKSDETKNLQPGSTLAENNDPKSDYSGIETEALHHGSSPEETRNIQSRSKLDQKPGCRSNVHPESTSRSHSEQTTDMNTGSRSGESKGLKLDLRTKESGDPLPGSRPEEARNLLKLKSSSDYLKSENTQDGSLGSGLDQRPASKSEPGFSLDVKAESTDVDPGLSEQIRNLESGSKSAECTDTKSDSTTKQTMDLNPGSGSEEIRDHQKLLLKSDERQNLKCGSRPELRSRPAQNKNLCPQSGSQETPSLKPRPRSQENIDLRSGSTDLQPSSGLKPQFRSDVNPGSKSETEDKSEPNRKQEVTKQLRAATTNTTSGHLAGQESMLGKTSAHESLLTNKRQQQVSSCERLMEKIWSWVQHGSSVLSNRCEAGRQLVEAEDTLATHLQLHTQAEAAAQDAESLKHLLDQLRALHTDPTSGTSPQPPIEASSQLSPLKALTEQLKRGGAGRPGAPEPAGSLSPAPAGRAEMVLKELHNLNRKIHSNLQLLKPYVSFLRTTLQVEEEMEELRGIYTRRLEEEEEEKEERTRTTPPVKKKQDACWQETLQSLLSAEELGKNCLHTVATVLEAGLNLQLMESVVQQRVEQLNRTKQEVNELRSQNQIRIQQQQEFCRKYSERLFKTLQDLNGVSELLDSCTLMDLGSDLQTSRLVERFTQARPHFTKLDTEVDHMEKSWETLRGVQDRLGERELMGKAVKEEDLSEVLKLQKRVKNKIQQSKSILDLTSQFHLTSRQLEELIQSQPAGSTGLCGSSEAILSRHQEEHQQVQSLLKTASALKADICTAIGHSGWTCFRVEQLEARLLSLDSLCVSWLNEAARREEKLRRELLTCRLNDDISQLRDSFKELKKRFSNLKFNYLKRNDRTRNVKAVRNQLQQVELYEEKLQTLRKRLQGLMARLGSEVKDGGVAREAEDAINELQRQMGEFERNVGEHKKTLDMTRRLQQAMEEYQFWCEEASATIARVGKFSSECRSTEAVTVLYQQFEKFVWPTVPEQEERISQISELAVRLHGVEEGRRYIERTVSKHSEMVEAIRELSDELMELEAKLKLESLKKQQNEKAEKEVKEAEETKRRNENEIDEKDKDKEKLKENRKNEQVDNRCRQEAADMYELKETGHTPELTSEHDGKEVPVKRQAAANRKPPLQKRRSQDSDRQSRQQLNSERTSSYCSTHTFSLSCSPVEANRQIHTIHSQLQPDATEPQATPPPSLIGPLFSDIQREFRKKEAREMGQSQDASAGGLSEAELQHQEAMTEDSLSNDEYECVSPDDISLPPLAETPESYMIQSDVEEGFCFSSHSTHVNQYSHNSGTGTGAVQQQRESSQSCPTPPTSLHSGMRFRSESSSFVQSPMTVPAPRFITRALCSILRTSEITTDNVSQSADLCLNSPELSFPSGCYPAHKNSPGGSNKENNISEKRAPSQTEPFLRGSDSQYNQPERSTGIQDIITQNVASRGETFPQTDPVPQAAELNLPSQGPDLHKDKTPSQNTMFLKCNSNLPHPTATICFPQIPSFSDSEGGLHQDINSSQTSEQTPLSKPQRSCLINPSIYFQCSRTDKPHAVPQGSSSLGSSQGNLVTQSETMSQIDPVPRAKGYFTDSALHQARVKDTGFTTSAQDNNLPQADPDSKSDLDQDVPFSQTSKETCSSLKPTANVTQRHIYCQSSHPDSHCNVPQVRSKQGSPLSQGNGGLPEVDGPIPSEPDNLSSISVFSSKNRQSHQTLYSLHEALISTCTQQCVHDPGMTPSSPDQPTAPPQPESQTQALAQQANLHVLSSPLHLLTPDQDPNICQPVAIREEIRLTPQIKGPSFPAPPALPLAQSESVPQGKASKPGPPSFTMPLSRATLMEGSPVTLEVEVTGHPEPTLSWFQDGEVSASGPGQSLACVDRKKASDSDGGLQEAQVNHHEVEREAANSCSSGDKWLVAEVFEIITVDWQTWFGTLCVLLWLLYLIVL